MTFLKPADWTILALSLLFVLLMIVMTRILNPARLYMPSEAAAGEPLRAVAVFVGGVLA